MYCKYCGRQIDNDAQFCPYCGKQVGGEYKAPNKKKHMAIIIAAAALAIAILAISCFFVFKSPIIENLLRKDADTEETDDIAADEDDFSANEEELDLDDYWNEPPDADEYFEENSQIVEKTDVNDSKDVLSEVEVIELLDERGFNDYPIITNYSMDGKYHEETAVSSSSNTKHPIFETYYVNSSNEYWIITVVEDDIFANPVSFNMQYSLGEKMMVSESDMITSYDSGSNRFYKTIPNPSTMTIAVVDRIDSKTLDEMTIEAMGE